MRYTIDMICALESELRDYLRSRPAFLEKENIDRIIERTCPGVEISGDFGSLGKVTEVTVTFPQTMENTEIEDILIYC